MEDLSNNLLIINGETYEVIKASRLMNGMVLKSGEKYARVGEKQPTLEEQVHTVSLYNRGFPVPQVLDSGELPGDKWFFTETSLGKNTFHKLFTNEYRTSGKISSETFSNYLKVIEKYTLAQCAASNRTSVTSADFISSLIPQELAMPNYCYFGHDQHQYNKAIKLVAARLEHVSMGVIQHDLNPFNVLPEGIIDFELVGYGPIGFDTLMSARWSTGWFTDYPSRYPVAYRFSPEQITENDLLIDDIATDNDISKPSDHMQEFLLLKSAWAVTELIAPDPSWPADKLAFRRYRANVLNHCVTAYLNGQEIDFSILSSITDTEI